MYKSDLNTSRQIRKGQGNGQTDIDTVIMKSL